MRNIVGPPARDENLFGREELINLVWLKLEVTNILLTAPRRFGKTSIMLNLYDYPREDFKVIHFDLEPVKEPVDFIVTLIDKIREDKDIEKMLKKILTGFKDLLSQFELELGYEGVEFKLKLKDNIKENWKETGKILIENLQKFDYQIILIFDEFAVMIENFLDNRLPENEVREFLHWFRSIRISPENTKCRFLIGSSVSIDHHLSRMGILPTFNDFERLAVKEFESEDIAKSFLELLVQSENIQVSVEGKNKILNLVGTPIPYFIQVFVSQLQNRCINLKIEINIPLIEKIYNEDVLGVAGKSYFQIYYDRLKYYEKINERTAKVLLKNLSLAEKVQREELYQLYLKEKQTSNDPDGFNDLMSNLENDFYIKLDYKTNSYVFYSKILKDWWKRYYSL